MPVLFSANEKISDIHPSPSTYAQMKENVDRVLQFMFANKIKMHHITTRGNSNIPNFSIVWQSLFLNLLMCNAGDAEDPY